MLPKSLKSERGDVAREKSSRDVAPSLQSIRIPRAVDQDERSRGHTLEHSGFWNTKQRIVHHHHDVWTRHVTTFLDRALARTHKCHYRRSPPFRPVRRRILDVEASKKQCPAYNPACEPNSLASSTMKSQAPERVHGRGAHVARRMPLHGRAHRRLRCLQPASFVWEAFLCLRMAPKCRDHPEE